MTDNENLVEIQSAELGGGSTKDEDVNSILEKVKALVANIEKAQEGLTPFQNALAAARQDETSAEAAAQAAKTAEIRGVYERALVICRGLIAEINKGGQNVVDRIKGMQAELKNLLEELRRIDPENLLLKEL